MINFDCTKKKDQLIIEPVLKWEIQINIDEDVIIRDEKRRIFKEKIAQALGENISNPYALNPYCVNEKRGFDTCISSLAELIMENYKDEI